MYQLKKQFDSFDRSLDKLENVAYVVEKMTLNVKILFNSIITGILFNTSFSLAQSIPSVQNPELATLLSETFFAIGVLMTGVTAYSLYDRFTVTKKNRQKHKQESQTKYDPHFKVSMIDIKALSSRK